MILPCSKCQGEGRIFKSKYGCNDPDVWDAGECDACEGSGDHTCEARALILLDYGQEEDICWLCVQQEGEHKGELWTWHNSEVRMLPNRTMLRL